jgi:hypothetical protein
MERMKSMRMGQRRIVTIMGLQLLRLSFTMRGVVVCWFVIRASASGGSGMGLEEYVLRYWWRRTSSSRVAAVGVGAECIPYN